MLPDFEQEDLGGEVADWTRGGGVSRKRGTTVGADGGGCGMGFLGREKGKRRERREICSGWWRVVAARHSEREEEGGWQRWFLIGEKSYKDVQHRSCWSKAVRVFWWATCLGVRR
ncbi:hypothetical protein HAX54_006084 [Datura stramonium]|uniref:Uncharacterized protein n=1 Tax=Datura stramonium TaxID=4076 RepID=A0ABS8TB40_DATST|nr:hypothetical protein [Datura stramonium]